MNLHPFHQEIIECTKCDRLRSWCVKIASEKKKAFLNETYWGKPVPGFGDPHARILIVGLAPAAHGANRTGRMFTGDNSGLWLYRALYEHGFSNLEISTHRKDSLQLKDVYITSIVHCAPPDNKPNVDETSACISYLQRELELLPNVRIILALGKFAWDGVLRVLIEKGDKKPKFGHGVVAQLGQYKLLGSYHPSQQNTFTGKLTKKMFDEVFAGLLRQPSASSQ